MSERRPPPSRCLTRSSGGRCSSAPSPGANVLRHDPPDRYVFNYRASYAEETDSVVHYLLKLRRNRPRQIAVFAQQDSYGDAGFAGVSKAFRSLGIGDTRYPAA